MKLEKDTYTKEEVAEILKVLNENVEGLKNQLQEKETQIGEYKENLADFENLKKRNLETNIKMELTKAGLNDHYFDLVVADDLETAQSKINKLAEIQKASIIDNSFRPNEHQKNNEYENAEKNKDTQSMVKSKLSKILG